MSNFIPNKIKRFVHRDPPWINKQLKPKKKSLFKKYKKHGYKAGEQVRLNTFRKECHEAVQSAKVAYLENLGNKLNDPNTSQKTYWKIINRVMNKCRFPKFQHLWKTTCLLWIANKKAKLFNFFFSKQCKPIITNSTLPQFNFITIKIIDHTVYFIK